MTTALYARVSTRGHDQNPETQLRKLREWAAGDQLDSQSVTEYVDQASAGDYKRRGAWRQLQDDIAAGKIRRVVVVRLDRAFRSSGDLYTTLMAWDAQGVEFVCITQPMIGIGDSMGRFMLAILGAAAELERGLIIERVHEGLDRARAEGKRLGRPPKYDQDVSDTIADLRAGGMSDRDISAELDIPRTSVRRMGGPKTP